MGVIAASDAAAGDPLGSYMTSCGVGLLVFVVGAVQHRAAVDEDNLAGQDWVSAASSGCSRSMQNITWGFYVDGEHQSVQQDLRPACQRHSYPPAIPDVSVRQGERPGSGCGALSVVDDVQP